MRRACCREVYGLPSWSRFVTPWGRLRWIWHGGCERGAPMRVDTAAWWRIRWQNLVAALAIAAGSCTLAVPLLHSGFPLGHDLQAHLTYTYLFDRALQSGQFPVRWTQGIRAGDGQLLFNFYQPGFYYVVQLVHL